MTEELYEVHISVPAKKVSLNTATPVHVGVVSSCFHATSDAIRTIWPAKLKICTIWPFPESSPTPEEKMA